MPRACDPSTCVRLVKGGRGELDDPLSRGSIVVEVADFAGVGALGEVEWVPSSSLGEESGHEGLEVARKMSRLVC